MWMVLVGGAYQNGESMATSARASGFDARSLFGSKSARGCGGGGGGGDDYDGGRGGGWVDGAVAAVVAVVGGWRSSGEGGDGQVGVDQLITSRLRHS